MAWSDFLKEKLEQRHRSLAAAFAAVDKSSTGVISPSDFQECLRGFNVRLTRQALAALVAKYDANGDGYVSYPEFVAVMTGAQPSAALAQAPSVAAPPGAVERAEETFRRVVFQESTSLTQAFLRIDRDRSGFCSPDELSRVFANAHVELTPAQLKELVARYDTNGDGRVCIRELSEMLNGGAAAMISRGAKRARA